MKDLIAVGIILSSPSVPDWVYKIIDQIVHCDFAKLQLVVFPPTADLQNNVIKTPDIFNLHQKLDRLFFTNQQSDDQMVDASDLLQEIPFYSIHISEKEFFFSVVSHNLDLLLNFSPIVFSDKHLALARYGVWHCDAEGQNIFRDIGRIYWAMVTPKTVINVSVRVTNGTIKSGTVIHRSWLPVNNYSVQINLSHLHNLYFLIIPRLISKIYDWGPAFVLNQAARYNRPELEFLPERSAYPSIYQLVRHTAGILLTYFYRRIAYKNYDTWFLMLNVDHNLFPILPQRYKTLRPSQGKAWADPFVISRNGRTFIFVEEFLLPNGEGHISVLELNNGGELLKVENVLEKPFHLSYPFIFELNEKWYMIPETSANRTIELYECIDFPRKWSFVMNLMENIDAVDSTLFFNNNRWWLFTALKGISSWPDYNELFLFSSETLFTNRWDAHPQNPINTDVRTARPAGRIFMQNGKIFRPSQDCSVRYGCAFNLNQIITLSETEYSEKVISKINANWDTHVQGTHTFNYDSNVAVIDAYQHQYRFPPKSF
jgi:hypothetical protein